jgi:hypothetical protein
VDAQEYTLIQHVINAIACQQPVSDLTATPNVSCTVFAEMVHTLLVTRTTLATVPNTTTSRNIHDTCPRTGP